MCRDMAKLPRIYCNVDKRDWIDVHNDGDHIEVEMCVEGKRGSVCLTPRQAQTLRTHLKKRIEQIK